MNRSFGQLVRERRCELGIALSALADRLRLSKSFLSMLENGDRAPADEQFEPLAAALEMPADLLRVAAGKLPADVANALPDRGESIVSTIRRADPGARITFPSHLSAAFQQLLKTSAQNKGPSGHITPYPDLLRVGKNSSTYRAHSYHTKVPPQAIEQLVRHHTREGHVIADPFCGSGMTGVAAIQHGRNAVLSDLSPAAVHIAQNYTTPCDVPSFIRAAERIAEQVRPTMQWLYETRAGAARTRVEYTVWSDVFECPWCAAEMVYWECARDRASGAVLDKLVCMQCGQNSEKRELRWVGERAVETNTKTKTVRDVHAPTSPELNLIDRANAHEILQWIPEIPFTASREMWRAAHTTQGIRSVADFYTKRNLHALGAIRRAIQEERDDRIRAALLFAFTAMVNRASKRYQWNVKRPTNVMTGTLYISSLRYEWNVWSLFERKVRDVARYYEHLGTPRGRAEVVLASATSLRHLDDESIDYVFMDPPFGANIFYADSSLLWDAWLGQMTDDRHEIVVNRHRSPAEGGKTLDDYQALMTDAFREVARILKPSAYATLQFNNSSDDVWVSIQDALNDAGLGIRHAIALDKIHPSIKGVKGRQAKEDVASTDTLLELRRTRRNARAAGAAHEVTQETLRAILVQLATTSRKPFSTDDAFSHVVRHALSSGISLSGISLRTIKALCGELFTIESQLWTQRPPAEAQTGYEPVVSPFGCVAAQYLNTDEDLHAVLNPSRPAPRTTGEPPRVIFGQRNTTFYNAHSYHTKVPPEAIIPFIDHYSRPGDVVLDPFCGSGMTGVAAMLSDRKAILSDLSVAATHLAYNHTRPCSPEQLSAAFDALAADLAEDFRKLYACESGAARGYVYYTLWSRNAICQYCEHAFPVWDCIDRQTGRMPPTVACPRCKRTMRKHSLQYDGNRPVLLNYKDAQGKRCERPPTVRETAQLLEQRVHNAPWFPQVQVEQTREMYIRSALHLQGIRTVADFYTPRNLHALSQLWSRIQDISDTRIRAALTFAFTNTAWHGTRMRRFNARGGQRPLTGTLYIPQLSSEVNVLEVMRNKVRQLHSYYQGLGVRKGPLPAIRLGSATQLTAIPDNSIDYVFTDPPFGSNIFYADCNLIWESWLGGLTRMKDEAVVNRSRDVARGGKTIADYELLMCQSMQEIHRVLKPRAWATLVFHNTDPDIWRALQNAAEGAGFRIDEATGLNRKQQSHKGYKGRAEEEDVAHFDVIMSMQKQTARKRARTRVAQSTGELIRSIFNELQEEERTVQRVHSEVIQRLARSGRDLGAISYEDVRMSFPELRKRAHS